MKTIIKYELVINKALRSALNYDTPDEQINEFIRFFGKHIGSDRIYIFEDCDEKHVTNNTYEWCADGIVPEIHELQNVDMDIIGWWYQAFGNEKNIIITDIEQIKDEIKGFFGVDNPPESDTLGLTTFLDMIGTLLISLLKLRNSFTKSNKEAKFSSYSSLSSIYISMAVVNVQTHRYHIVKTLDEVVHFLGVKPQSDGEYRIDEDFPGHINSVMDEFCTKAHREETLEFVDITTVEDRLRGKNTIVHEFTGKVSGWCRERFIPVDYDADGRLWHVLYCVENIDEEKRRENRLMYLAQTDLMTGIRNRGSGENKITEYLVRKQCGLLCLLDCDKFKSINDTYGHAVGDKVIIAIADTLRKSCRDDDVVLRLGGDEFAVFIPGMLDKERAETFFDRLFSNIEHIDIAEMKGKHILLSLGACFYDGMDCITFDQLYRRADTAMYDSKKKQGYSATIFDAKQ